MGLFGGFKAKFIKNSKPKEKRAIVSLNYRMKADFDSQEPPNLVSIGVRSVLRKDPSRPKSENFEETSKAIRVKLKSASLLNLSNESTVTEVPPQKYEEPSPSKIKSKNFNDDTEATSSVQIKPKNRIFPTNKEKILTFSNNFQEYNGANSLDTPNSINSAHEDDFGKLISDNSDSALILMTQNSDVIPNYENKVTLQSHTSTQKPTVEVSSKTEEKFKINIMQYDKNYVPEDESSESDLEEEPEDVSSYPRISFGYSSQASDLFFGNTEPTVITRPRTLRFKKQNDEDNEIDC